MYIYEIYVYISLVANVLFIFCAIQDLIFQIIKTQINNSLSICIILQTRVEDVLKPFFFTCFPGIVLVMNLSSIFKTRK